MGKYYDAYKKYYILDGKANIIGKSNQKYLSVDTYTSRFQNIYSNNISPQNLNGSGAKILTQTSVTKITGNFTDFKEMLNEKLVSACIKSINQLLPTIKDIQTNDNTLDGDLATYRGYQIGVEELNKSLIGLPVDSPKRSQIINDISSLKSKANDLLSKINETIKALNTLCFKANGIISAIWALNGDSSSEMKLAPINYDFFPNGIADLGLIRYSNEDILRIPLTPEELLEGAELLYPPEGTEECLGGSAKYYKNGDYYLIKLPGNLIYVTDINDMTESLINSGWTENDLNSFMGIYYTEGDIAKAANTAVNNGTTIGEKTKALLQSLYDEMYANPEKALLVAVSPKKDETNTARAEGREWIFVDSNNNSIKLKNEKDEEVNDGFDLIKGLLTKLFNSSLEEQYNNIKEPNKLDTAKAFVLTSTLTPFIRAAYINASVESENNTCNIIGYDTDYRGFVCDEFVSKVVAEAMFQDIIKSKLPSGELYNKLKGFSSLYSMQSIVDEVIENSPGYDFKKNSPTAANFTNENSNGMSYDYKVYDLQRGERNIQYRSEGIQAGSIILRQNPEKHVIYVVERFEVDGEQYLLYADSGTGDFKKSKTWNSYANEQISGPRLRVVEISDLDNKITDFNQLEGYTDYRESLN